MGGVLWRGRFVETDDFFTAAASKLYEEDDRPFKGDWLIEFKGFRQLMRKLAKVKYPLAPKVDDALQCLVDRYLGPLAKVRNSLGVNSETECLPMAWDDVCTCTVVLEVGELGSTSTWVLFTSRGLATWRAEKPGVRSYGARASHVGFILGLRLTTSACCPS